MPLLSKPGLELPRFGLPWRGLGPSLAAHTVALILCMVNPDLAVKREPPETTVKHAVPLFVPRPSIARAIPRKQNTPDFRPQPMATLRLQAEEEPLTPDVRIDMNSVQITFAEDITNQLPGVILEHDGMLALTDKDDPGVARYLIEPPGWAVRETLVDVSRKVRFAMYPPQKWTLLRTIAREHAIALDRYQVCALFESVYKRCLLEAIRARVVTLSGGRQVRVQSARLAFQGNSPCGVEVLEVSFAAVSGQ